MNFFLNFILVSFSFSFLNLIQSQQKTYSQLEHDDYVTYNN